MLWIGHLCPNLLNLYGDGGNIVSLGKRCQWRELDYKIVPIRLEDMGNFNPQEYDILMLGGGSDREQSIISKILYEKKEELRDYVENSGVLLAICGGYQLLGHYYRTDMGEKMQGLGILDITTESAKKRMIGDIVIQSDWSDIPVVGFENHMGKTTLGAGVAPFGTVKNGYGNNGEDAKEGAVYKNCLGTYLHGPLLPKNPRIADQLLERALERKHGEPALLKKLDDTVEESASRAIIEEQK